MKVQQKIDKVLEVIREKVQDEVGSLMGVNFILSEIFTSIESKENYFVEQSGKKIVAKMDVTGDVEGLGCLVISVKDAIRLGGTLIMLPKSELDEVVNDENYSEETEDSYGEIANIIAGSYTKVFEDMYPQNVRFIRKEQELVSPLKIDTDSDEPVPNQYYYVARASMTMEDVAMGDLDMLIPAEAFGIEVPEEALAEKQENETTESVAEVQGAESHSDGVAQEEQSDVQAQETSVAENQQSIGVETDSSAEIQEEASEPEIPQKSKAETEKHRKLVDNLLTSCNETLATEVGSLLGVDVKLTDYEFRPVSKEEFLHEEISGKHVLANMDLVDDAEGKGFLFASLKDAIRIGSILIMLPPSELEIAVNEEELSPDSEDAYGEIANIISGAYTSFFQDQYTQSIRFIKTDIETVKPMKVDIESDEVMPNQMYYLNIANLHIDGQQYGQLSMLIPLDFLELDQLAADEVKADDKQADDASQADGVSSSAATAVEGVTGQASQPAMTGLEGKGSGERPHSSSDESYEILLIENDKSESGRIEEELIKMGISAKTISYTDDVNFYLNAQLRLVVIVMQEVNDQAYGVAIKVNTNCSVPIVAAGNQWTRSKVIKAVKYGVSDILLTPADNSDIQQKIEGNILRLAA